MSVSTKRHRLQPTRNDEQTPTTSMMAAERVTASSPSTTMYSTEAQKMTLTQNTLARG